MEPAEKPVRRKINIGYTVIETVTKVADDNSKEWYFETHGNRYWTGFLRPDFAPGDRVKITITKESTPDAILP